MPALDEERSIGRALEDCAVAVDRYGIACEILVIDDGSRDGTRGVAEAFAKKDDRVRVLRHDAPRGVGASFWRGVDEAKGDCVVMLPGDNENDPAEILRYFPLLGSVDIVIPFVFNKQVRSLLRNGLSFVYRFIINTTFLVYLNYTNGTNLYRVSVLRELEHRSEGFFFQTDILIRLVKKGYLFAEVPYRLGLRRDGASRATTFPSFLQVVRGYVRLVRDIYLGPGKTTPFTADSATTARSR